MKKIVKISGGIGNQLFQYAFSESLKAKGHHVYLDFDFYRRQSKRQPIIKDLIDDYEEVNGYIYLLMLKAFSKFFFLNHLYCIEQGTGYSSSYQNNNSIVYEGYWQSRHYLLGVEDTIIKLFDKVALPSKLAGNIDLNCEGLTSLHIRRGDYLQLQDYHGVLPLDYYANAIKIIKNISGVIKTLLIFTDDPTWAKENISFDDISLVFVSDLNLSDIQEVKLFSLSNNKIIANSTFSWWGAKLGELNNKNNGMTILPKQWFSHLDNNSALYDDFSIKGGIFI